MQYIKQLKYIFLIVGTFIGAGFISGKELFSFFAKYGKTSILFIFILFIILFILFYFSIKYFKNKNNKVLDNVFVKYLVLIIYILISANMISSFNLIFKSNTISFYLIYLIIAVFLVLILKFGFTYILLASNFIVPAMILLFLICIFNNSSLSFAYVIANSENWIFLILKVPLYIFLNYALLINLLHDISKQSDTKPKFIAFFSSFIIATLIFIGVVCLLNNYNSIQSEPMPFVSLLVNDSIYSILFKLTFFISIITTLISCSFVANSILSSIIKRKNLSICLVIGLIMCLSFLGFENIVDYIYPIMGVFGLVIALKIIVA